MIRMNLQLFGGRGGGSGMTSSSSGGGGGLSGVLIGTLEWDGEKGYVPSGQSISVDLSNKSAVKQAASDYFEYLNKSGARSRAESIMNGANESNDSGGYLIRNTIQNMYNSQAGNNNTRIYNSEIDKALSEVQKNIIYNSIQDAARDFIEHDKQSKAGANYWKKRGL